MPRTVRGEKNCRGRRVPVVNPAAGGRHALAGGVSRQGALVAVMVLLALTAFITSRMSREVW